MEVYVVLELLTFGKIIMVFNMLGLGDRPATNVDFNRLGLRIKKFVIEVRQ